MPSPFPGMDPYIESPLCWPGFHYRLPGLIADHLQPQLSPRYVAIAEERVYLQEPERELIPDVAIRRHGEPTAGRGSAAPSQAQSTGVTTLPLWIEAPELVEEHEYYVEIRALPGQELVTIIEVLSPSNKGRSGPGRARYLRKQRRILRSDVNLVEIDLLRGGAWTVALPPSERASLPPHDYRVCVRRVERPGGFEFYPFQVTDSLPDLQIPLRASDEDASLNLQTVFAEAYDRSMVATRIDYTAEPEPPLAPPDAVWADEILRATGQRGSPAGA